MTSGTPPPSRRPAFLQISLATQLLILIVLVTLISAVAVHTYVRQQQLTETQNQLDLHAKVLTDRLSDYETLLLSTYSFLYADKQPGTDISTFTTGLHLEQYFPSVHELNILRFSGGRLAQPPRQLGPVTFGPQAGQMIQQTVNAAVRSGTTGLTAPFSAQSRSPLGEEYHSLLVVKPCAVLPTTGKAPCALYALVNVEQLLEEVKQLSPVSTTQVKILMDGRPLSPEPREQSGLLALIGQPVALNTGASGDLLQTTVPRLGHDWTLQVRVPQLSARDPSSLLAPLVVMMGLLAGLLTHRLVSDQLRLNRRLQQANLDLGASQSFLEQSRADFSAIFQAMDGGAAFTTPDGFVRMMNRRYLDLLGLEFRGLAGAHIDQVREQTVVDEPGNRHALFSDESPEEYSGVVRRLHGPGGQTFWGEMSRIRVMGQGQELLGYLHVLRDVSEALESQQRLRDQEQQSRAALDGVPHVLWLSNRRGRLTYANQQFRDLLSGPVVREQVHPEDLAAYDDLWEVAYASGQQQEADLRLALRTPEAAFLHGQQPSAPAPGWRWVSLKVAPLHTISGEVNEWIAVATDVHARLMAEQLALAEQDHYRMVLSGMPQLVWTVDADWNVTYVNGRWYDLQPGLPAPVDLDDLALPVHPDDLDRFYQAVAEARSMSRPLEVEVQMVGPEGHYRTYVVRAVPLLGAGDDVVEWVGTTTDVDDQVRAEFRARLMVQISDALSHSPLAQGNELLIQRRSYQHAVELMAASLGAAVALWRTDPLPSEPGSEMETDGAPAQPQYQIHWMGQSFKEDYQLTPEMMQTIEELVRGAAARQEAFVDRDSSLLQALGTAEFLSLPLRGHDGSLRGMLGLAFPRPIHSYDFELAEQVAQRFALALDNDVLRQRASLAQEELQQLNRSLEQRVRERTQELGEANRELEAFSYSVSHDLRTPLRHMTGFGELLRKKLQAENEDLSQQAERYLNVILNSGQRMGHLIDDLLEFSRTGRAELRQQRVDLGALVTGVWAELQPDREGHSVALQLEPLPTVYGDERLLAQVFTNLLGNALKYSRTREEVLIRVDSVPDGEEMAEIRVHDNGVGFDPRYTDKLFGVFQRLHNSDEFEGTGIGLANVRRIIQRHGGRVSAHGEPGVGATFSVTLPLQPRPELPVGTETDARI